MIEGPTVQHSESRGRKEISDLKLFLGFLQSSDGVFSSAVTEFLLSIAIIMVTVFIKEAIDSSQSCSERQFQRCLILNFNAIYLQFLQNCSNQCCLVKKKQISVAQVTCRWFRPKSHTVEVLRNSQTLLTWFNIFCYAIWITAVVYGGERSGVSTLPEQRDKRAASPLSSLTLSWLLISWTPTSSFLLMPNPDWTKWIDFINQWPTCWMLTLASTCRLF